MWACMDGLGCASAVQKIDTLPSRGQPRIHCGADSPSALTISKIATPTQTSSTVFRRNGPSAISGCRRILGTHQYRFMMASTVMANASRIFSPSHC